ncbi:type II toxin-antitoxin system Phd/YefM family antitoxin [Pseudomonas frederiksbergensis]|uniref:type II toxin-antitoxin system Phd/YefM family antitoxin n=1 Tax=Pseudomonas frederiksbergensis TaxID=104087 RepID=UPI001E2AA8B9|nr:type II toxin-antitoxin system Phd/YefM family antitoxin [Pseudomonas frederiksbergensis]
METPLPRTAQAGGGDVVAILNRNEPAFYCVPADRYEAMLDLIDDLKLAKEVKAQLEANEPRIPAKIVNGDLLVKGESGFDDAK